MRLSCLAYPNNNPSPGAIIGRATIIGCVSPEADHETRLQVRGVYLGGDPKKHWQERRKVRKGREASQCSAC